MFEVILELGIHLTFKVFAGLCFYMVNPYLAYGFAALESYSYLNMIKKIIAMREFVKSLENSNDKKDD